MDTMIISHNREKLLNLIAYFVKNTKFCGKTKLFKLLYYADFWHFKETGKTITGLKYYTWQKGPVPKELFFEFKKPKDDFNESFLVTKTEDDSLKIVSKKKFDGRHFTKREMKILENVSFIFKDVKAFEMVKCTHLPSDPWSKTLKEKGEDREIDYTLAFDNTSESLSLEDYKHRIEELSEIKEILP
jgi:uncharacterized phage-associated protein